ncbi:MAG: glycosyltransferase [Melioribacteraceae bacterium]|nr:glycosyltransferase [Melioribacteraceae bacterium]
MTGAETIAFLILLISHAIFLSIVFYNYFTGPRIVGREKESHETGLVSILIPARNEENNIAGILESVSKQTHNNYEVIVLNDNSTDRTYEIAKKYTDKIKRFKIINGEKLPDDWIGKNWACYQLAREAKGDYLLFIDADVILHPDAVRYSLDLKTEKNASMLSVFPTQEIDSPGEWLVVPLMNWLLLTFLPLKKVYTSDDEKLSAANGQFILIDRETYFNIGTHKAYSKKVVEDMEIAREVKRSGRKLLTGLGGDKIKCRMYNSFNDAYNGFSKNFYYGTNLPGSVFFIIILVLLFLFTAPFVLMFFNPVFIIPVVMILLERLIVSLISRQNLLLNPVLHLLQMLIMFSIGINSLYGRNLKWKGRKI